MPLLTLHLESPIRQSFRTLQVRGMFDLPLAGSLQHDLTAELPTLDEPWTIGAIVGPSGSGKTTLARAAFNDCIAQPLPWPDDAAIIDVLGNSPTLSIKTITRVLTAVGLGSVPTWLRPYGVLSTGEQARADIARALLGTGDWGLETRGRGSRDSDAYAPAPNPQPPVPLLVLDEFTSPLDRTTARTLSAALSRLVRASPAPSLPLAPSDRNAPLRLVVLSCHEDIVPWLAPDWVLLLGGNAVEKGSGVFGGDVFSTMDRPSPPKTPDPLAAARLIRGPFPRPHIPLRIGRVPQAMWRRFAPHHYLAGGLARSATCYAAWEGGTGDWKLGAGNATAPHASTSCSLAPSPQPLAPVPPPAAPIAFCAVIPALGWKNTKRITRLVVLPQFQGLGIGSRLAEAVAELEHARGQRVTITATHPAIIAHCARSPRWRYVGLKKNGSTRQQFAGRPIRSSLGRAVASFEWQGD